MDFGEALRIIKDGGRVCRSGWNGKNMYIYLRPEFYSYDGSIQYEAAVVMHTAQGLEQPGWLASQLGMLAEDWDDVSE